MLEQYLKQQDDNLQLMLKRRQQLQKQAEQEQRRLLALSQHLATMDGPEQMACSLSLQNLSGIKQILHSLQQEQQQRTSAAAAEVARQQQVCVKQAALNLGLHDILSQQQRQQQLERSRLEQRQQDELSQQLLQQRPRFTP